MTTQAPAGRVAAADEIAPAISYLVGPGVKFVQSAVLAVDGDRTAVSPIPGKDHLAMNIASLRMITDDVARIVGFYEHVTGLTAAWATPDFAEISTPTFTLAIGHTRTVGVFGPGSARPADNHSLIVEFLTDDVDADYTRLRQSHDIAVEFVNEPTDMPWGNRSLLLRDPDGTLINLFTPVTAPAIAKWATR